MKARQPLGTISGIPTINQEPWGGVEFPLFVFHPETKHVGMARSASTGDAFSAISIMKVADFTWEKYGWVPLPEGTSVCMTFSNQ